MKNYLYCIVNCTSSKTLPGWDVEVFYDNEKVRNLLKNYEHSNYNKIQDELCEELSDYGLSSYKAAQFYVAKLSENYNMLNFVEIQQ